MKYVQPMGGVASVAFSPDGGYVLLGSENKSPHSGDYHTERNSTLRGTYQLGHLRRLQSAWPAGPDGLLGRHHPTLGRRNR